MSPNCIVPASVLSSFKCMPIIMDWVVNLVQSLVDLQSIFKGILAQPGWTSPPSLGEQSRTSIGYTEEVLLWFHHTHYSQVIRWENTFLAWEKATSCKGDLNSAWMLSTTYALQEKLSLLWLHRVYLSKSEHQSVIWIARGFKKQRHECPCAIQCKVDFPPVVYLYRCGLMFPVWLDSVVYDKRIPQVTTKVRREHLTSWVWIASEELHPSNMYEPISTGNSKQWPEHSKLLQLIEA